MKKMIKFPIEVNEIKFEIDKPVDNWVCGAKAGSFVAVRPCIEKFGGKTYLGLMIGSVPVHASAEYDRDSKILTFSQHSSNPAIFVFDFNEVVVGAESWWHKIESEEDLSQISNKDIDNVWYVKALKCLDELEGGGGE